MSSVSMHKFDLEALNLRSSTDRQRRFFVSHEKCLSPLLLVLQFWDGNQPIVNRGLGIFWCGWI